MANSYYTIQITDNNLSGNFLKVEILPDGNIDKWSTTTFVVGSTSNYYECEIGSDIEQTIINLKAQLDNYYIGNSVPGPVYNTTITATDTLKVELIDPYLKFNVLLQSGLDDNAVVNTVNADNVKYTVEYLDVVNTKHIFNLYDDEYYSSPIEVNGAITMDYGQVDENLESIRGQGLRVSLDADASLTYEELFQGQEKTFRVEYFRDSVLLFQGWLNPEGFYEDYVNDKWEVSFDCIDGLGYLKNLAFVNSDGTNITGIKTQLEILSLALQRTGINVDINVAINIFYTGLADTESILANVNANTKRYIKDDDVTVMNCEEVIRDVLEPYGAVLTSYNGQWVIYKPNELFNDTEAVFFRYDYLGAPLSPTTVTYDFSLNIGSDLDGFNSHYCNANQSFTNKPSFGAYRISYKYGFLKELLPNPTLFTSNGTSYDNWTINQPALVTVPSAGESGSMILLDKFGLGNFNPVLTPDGFTTAAGNSFNYTITGNLIKEGEGRDLAQLRYYIELFDGTTYYRLLSDGTWSSNPQLGILTPRINYGAPFTITGEIPNSKDGGELRLVLGQPYENQNLVTDELYVDFSLVSINPQEGNAEIQGEIFTFERETKPSARIEKTREVFTGDSDLDIYEGTLYKADGITPTETWYRKGVTESVPILEMMGSETMRMNANTMRIFSGDIFGYFNYLSIVDLDQQSGKYAVTKYSYDTYRNVISIELKQMFGDELTDLDVQKTLDYGNVVEPTIRG